jgi:hypothetical protein
MRDSRGKMVKDLSYRTTLSPFSARVMTLVYLAWRQDELQLDG